jgi:hypothetical protein
MTILEPSTLRFAELTARSLRQAIYSGTKYALSAVSLTPDSHGRRCLRHVQKDRHDMAATGNEYESIAGSQPNRYAVTMRLN